MNDICEIDILPDITTLQNPPLYHFFLLALNTFPYLISSYFSSVPIVTAITNHSLHAFGNKH